MVENPNSIHFAGSGNNHDHVHGREGRQHDCDESYSLSSALWDGCLHETSCVHVL